MSPAARSIKIFGAYLLLLALILLLAPNLLLGLVRMAPTSEVWIRVVGMVVGFLGFYYWQAARAELKAFFAWTIPVRLSVPAFFAAFVTLGMVDPTLLLFGAVDAAAALWTWSALRRG
jgi:hypothetical protein